MARDRSVIITELLAQRCRASVSGGHPRCTLFLSASDGTRRARVLHASGDTPLAVWQAIAGRAEKADGLLQSKWLRVDWVEAVEAIDWQTLRARLHETKRNYFRQGIALDAGFGRAFLELELNGNATLYGGNGVDHAVVNESNFLVYARRKYGAAATVDFGDDRPVFVFTTGGAFIDGDDRVHDLVGAGSEAGYRRLGALTPDIVRGAIDTGSQYLGRQVHADGSFVYGYHPCFDRTIDTYNTLRHASTAYAMTEAWELTGDNTLGEAVERSLGCLVRRFIRQVTLPDGSEAAFLVDTGDEIKLGGNAVAVLALSKYTAVTGDECYLPLLDRLANGIAYMRQPETGGFVHVLNSSDLSVKQAFRTIYYEGEAAFALMRLYGLTRNERWIAIVEKAFDHFIAGRYWQYHDHWLGYCVNELTKHRPEERYFRFGINNVSGLIDFIRTRITTFPTLLELSMAAQQMLMRIADTPRFGHLLTEIDLERFREALDFRARYLLNGYFWPEMAMYFRSPETVAGAFFIRHHAFRVRIDDVEHYLSGLIAYGNFLREREAFDRLVDSRRGLRPIPWPAGGIRVVPVGAMAV